MKAFLEEVEQRLDACPAAELRAILRAMARATPPPERGSFLVELQPVEETAQTTLGEENLLAEIDAILHELRACMEQEDEHWFEWDDEDSLGPYEDFVAPLTALFDRAEAVFDYGNLAIARDAYHQLFQVFGLEDEYGRGVQRYDLTDAAIDEAGARYLRAVYETEPQAQRPSTLSAQMLEVWSWLDRKRYMLYDIIQISTRPLPDYDCFLTDWIAFLREQSAPSADAWLREAIGLSQGTEGLAKLARVEGRKRPRAYLDWLTALVEEGGEDREVLAVAQEGLQALPSGLPIRAAIADRLCTAAAKLGEGQTLRSGRWEAFIARPILSRLLDLWNTTSDEAEKKELMSRAAQSLKAYLGDPPGFLREEWREDQLEMPVWTNESTLAHAYLLAEDWDKACQLASAHKELGWSSISNPQGLVVPFFMALLAGESPNALPANLDQLWGWALERSVGFTLFEEKEEYPLLRQLKDAYTTHLSKALLNTKKQEQILSWSLEMVKRRVEAIVGGQHRKSYNKAAEITVAAVEMLQLREENRRAELLLDETRDRFPRHRSFQAELVVAIKRMRHGSPNGLPR
ncbi:MAG: hypothetical protein U9N00_02755 [Candidatus Bipolaricaulota bacterium]|nr:hypothetical protein [Candidatus Bipolaricaulota bacterium]